MKNVAVLSRSGALVLTLFIWAATTAVTRAQSPESTPSAGKASPVDPVSQPEWLKSYLQVRDQLQATQLAIVTNRAESEATARAQAATLAEKIETLKVALAAERERQQLELQRANTERERQQADADRTNRTFLLVAAAFGALGVAGIFLLPYLQLRAINRMADVTAARPQLPSPGTPNYLPGGETAALSDQAVAHSNQRLMLAIERIEQKIADVERSANPTAALSPTVNGSHFSKQRANGSTSGAAARIDALLGKGRSLFNANKTLEALACYDEILKIELSHPEALVRKGAALERLKQDAEAIQCYDQAIAADRKMTLAYLHKGGVCNRLERYEEALQCYELALRAEDDR